VRLADRPGLLALFVLTLPLVTPKIRGADEIECFSYLRSLAFDRDLEFGNEYAHFHERDPRGLAGFKATFLDLREPRTGRHINFAPLGAGLLWSPFYLLAHGAVLVARAAGASVEADGFSVPYVASACYASALYGFLGLLLVHDALRRYGGFDAPVATAAVAALWLGTPVLYYMSVAAGFSHAPALFSVGALFWLSLRTSRSERSSLLDWALIGALGGLAALVREQDALFLCLPAGLLLQQSVRTRSAAGGALKLLTMLAAAAAVFAPQLIAYRAINGGFGPSRMVSRKLTYSSPHFLEVLFDPGHGLYFWSPLLLLASAGLLVLLLRRRDALAALLLLAFLLQVWINGSLESWTQAGAFGSRRFVSSTPVLAWGLAGVLAAARTHRARALAGMALAVGVWWNVSLMVQFGLKLMDRQRLEWPRVAVNQLVEVPRHLARAALLFFTDRERLVKEGV
jgi:hypothetical protein